MNLDIVEIGRRDEIAGPPSEGRDAVRRRSRPLGLWCALSGLEGKPRSARGARRLSDQETSYVFDDEVHGGLSELGAYRAAHRYLLEAEVASKPTASAECAGVVVLRGDDWRVDRPRRPISSARRLQREPRVTTPACRRRTAHTRRSHPLLPRTLELRCRGDRRSRARWRRRTRRPKATSWPARQPMPLVRCKAGRVRLVSGAPRPKRRGRRGWASLSSGPVLARAPVDWVCDLSVDPRDMRNPRGGGARASRRRRGSSAPSWCRAALR
jgi:hypothetical protein